MRAQETSKAWRRRYDRRRRQQERDWASRSGPVITIQPDPTEHDNNPEENDHGTTQ